MNRQQFRRMIELSQRAVSALESSSLDGMTQKEFLSRLVEFYADVSTQARKLILNTLPAKYAEDAADDLKRELIERAQRLERDHPLSKSQQGPKVDKALAVDDD